MYSLGTLDRGSTLYVMIHAGTRAKPSACERLQEDRGYATAKLRNCKEDSL
jgi:hypothetical protein